MRIAKRKIPSKWQSIGATYSIRYIMSTTTLQMLTLQRIVRGKDVNSVRNERDLTNDMGSVACCAIMRTFQFDTYQVVYETGDSALVSE